MVVGEREPRAIGAGASAAELVAAARLDPTSFLALYERYFPRVQRYVRIRISDRATCEDITSEVFLAALAGLREFRGSGSFAAWQFRIAQNAVRSHYRTDRPTQLDEAAVAAVAGPGPDPMKRRFVASDAAI
jgi:DNA-directed RNA polymerase specialized sigma24 family protein